MYIVRFYHEMSELKGDWSGKIWSLADIGEIDRVRPESSSHIPKTKFRLLYSDSGISGIFIVEDRYVKCLHSGFMAPVYKDSCVEFFVKPSIGNGYFNFEFNCGGSVLCRYITDCRRTAGGFKESVPLSDEDLRLVKIFHSLPGIIEEEIEEDVVWFLEFFIPFSVLERYSGPFGNPTGHIWTANFHKCGDDTSHPHWVSWQPIPELNFHMPDFFGDIFFLR